MAKMLKDYEGKVFAFTTVNRVVNKARVQHFVSELKKDKCFYESIKVIKASAVDFDLIEATLDSSKVTKITKKANTFVILEGQHRYLAALAVKGEDEELYNNVVVEEITLPSGISAQEWIAKVNSDVKGWSGKDYINSAFVTKRDDEVVKFAQELNEKGISGKTIVKLLTFGTKFKLVELITENVDKVYNGVNLAKAKKVWEVLQTFPAKVYKKSALIDVLMVHNNELNDATFAAVLEAFKAMEDKEELESLKNAELREHFETAYCQAMRNFNNAIDEAVEETVEKATEVAGE